MQHARNPKPTGDSNCKANLLQPGKSVYVFVVGLFCCSGKGVCYVLLFGRGGVVGGWMFFCYLSGVRALFLLSERGRVLFLAVWAGGVFCFLQFGRGRVCFFAVWAGTGVHSLTSLPG